MIDDIELVATNDVFLAYTWRGIPGTIPFEAIQLKWFQVNETDGTFWSELDAETFEGGSAVALDDDRIIATAYIAQGQSGAVFIWDASVNQIVHMSNGNFAVAGAADEKFVYTLNFVNLPFRFPEMTVCRAPYGISDFTYSEPVDVQVPFTVDDYIAGKDCIAMTAEENYLDIYLNGKRYYIPITE